MCDEGLSEWLSGLMSKSGLPAAVIARITHYDRSTVHRACSGRVLPSQALTQAIAAASGGDANESHERWENAREGWRTCAQRVAAGWPPCSLTDHTSFLSALHTLISQNGFTQRALARKAALPRSTLGDVLRDKVSLRWEVVGAIVDTCGVSVQAKAEWVREWERLVLPELQARRRRRVEGFHTFYGGRW